MNGSTSEGSDAGFEAAMAEALAAEATKQSSEPDPVDRFFLAFGSGDEKAARGALREAVRRADTEAKTAGKAADGELREIQRTEPERKTIRERGQAFKNAAAAVIERKEARRPATA